MRTGPGVKRIKSAGVIGEDASILAGVYHGRDGRGWTKTDVVEQLVRRVPHGLASVVNERYRLEISRAPLASATICCVARLPTGRRIAAGRRHRARLRL